MSVETISTEAVEGRQEPVEATPATNTPEPIAATSSDEGSVNPPENVATETHRPIYEPGDNSAEEQKSLEEELINDRNRRKEREEAENSKQEITQQPLKTGRSTETRPSETRQQRRERLSHAHGSKIADTYAEDNGLTGHDKIAYDWIKSVGGFDKYAQLGEGLAVFKSENKNFDFNKDPKLQAEIKERADQILRNYKHKEDFKNLDKQIPENQIKELAATVESLQKDLSDAQLEIDILTEVVENLKKSLANGVDGNQIDSNAENISEGETDFEHTGMLDELSYSGKLLYEVRSSGKIKGLKQLRELEQVAGWVLNLENPEEGKNLVDRYINPNKLKDRDAIIDLTDEIVIGAAVNEIKILNVDTSLNDEERNTELERYLNVLTGGMAQPEYIKNAVQKANSKISSTATQPVSQLYP